MGTGARRRARRALIERDGWICWVCQGSISPNLAPVHPLGATIDHILPLSAGGDHDLANLALAHYRCNQRRQHRWNEDRRTQ